MGKAKVKLIRFGACALASVLISFGSAANAIAQGPELVPMGCVIGIEMETKGVLVSGLSPLETEAGCISPAGEAGIKPGDVIIRLGSKCIDSSEDLVDALGSLSEDKISITVTRCGKPIQYTVAPKYDASGTARLGLWLRDSVAGIGTVTYYDPDTGEYGALGHGINDTDSGVCIPLGSGSIMNAEVIDVKAGKCGEPGELHGRFSPDDVCGTITDNTESGIFGSIEAPDGIETMPTADDDEIELGKAVIRSNISGCSIEDYSVEITRLYKGCRDGRCMMITVTDPRLLEATGGIVQGMSGSPIIQNGRIIGAVTHVLIDDPTRGYGISIAKMLSAARECNKAA